MDFSTFSKESPAHNDFRSDTFTTPTVSMIQSLATTSLGDSVYNEDSKTKELEQKVAELTGKEAGLYCVSGTLSNQIAMRVNLFQPPYSVLTDSKAHVYVDEAAGLSTLTQARPQPITPKNGIHLTLEDDILPNFIPDDGEIHSAPTKLICLENTLHGMIFPIEEIKKISKFCKENDVKLHLDGARLWNASVATGISLKEYSKYFDSVSLCLSKTLGAPIGTVLVGDKKFILKANHFKKQNGGGIRQSGLLASMAITAIDENFSKLQKTHEMAKELGDLCNEKGIILEHPVQTNFVFIDITKNKIDPNKLVEISNKYGVKIYSGRVAFHYQISKASFEKAKQVILEAVDDDLIEYLEDDFNFETTLRLLNDLKLQSKIQNLKSPIKYKQLVSNLFTRHVLNKQLQKPIFYKLEYSYNQYGKPILPGISFNSSSSNEIIAIAISNKDVGIDLSHTTQNISSTDYIEQFKPMFSADEIDQVTTYFKFNHLWTLKEAFTKLLGCGLNIDLSKFHFELNNFNDEFGMLEKENRGEEAIVHMKWYDNISINAEQLFNEENEFVEGFKNQFYCYSTCLKYSIDSLPVICSLITPEPVKIQCIEIDFLQVLSNQS
ncbi:GLY1 [Candida pseudojiufengensis]|uniref:GLY1 n=1 Tax=Candida pseudojiufengensis TaxID=497109 RepID=UPI002223F9D7|nr:GLY1 [Candida pseudojiufengensis]KAI5962393.1 GLY1 [Candida pseudojiufengensis]